MKPGVDEKFEITREQILATYAAGTDAIVALIERMSATIEKLSMIVEQQEQRIKALEEELRKDSHNSGKPPSRDSFERKQVQRKKPRSARKKKPGGQNGIEERRWRWRAHRTSSGYMRWTPADAGSPRVQKRWSGMHGVRSSIFLRFGYRLPNTAQSAEDVSAVG